MKLNEDREATPATQKATHQLAQGELGHRDFPRDLSSCCHRSAFLLELACRNHCRCPLLGGQAVLVSAWVITGY